MLYIFTGTLYINLQVPLCFHPICTYSCWSSKTYVKDCCCA